MVQIWGFSVSNIFGGENPHTPGRGRFPIVKGGRPQPVKKSAGETTGKERFQHPPPRSSPDPERHFFAGGGHVGPYHAGGTAWQYPLSRTKKRRKRQSPFPNFKLSNRFVKSKKGKGKFGEGPKSPNFPPHPGQTLPPLPKARLALKRQGPKPGYPLPPGQGTQADSVPQPESEEAGASPPKGQFNAQKHPGQRKKPKAQKPRAPQRALPPPLDPGIARQPKRDPPSRGGFPKRDFVRPRP
ncbi:basic salivary proline-rich protein 3-like [Penaeus monodon]|uniref:basic salivary proline-rich protein 3-like n=1 Tax=Penaeus monodon TaxID=6687 RepID=UPI0018A7BC1A|nr:basic salivary proline-rich protein 3-like [Penaeus monodon]